MPGDSTSWTRHASLEALAGGDRFDLLVVGGGVIGAATALDAAARGLRVALVEQKDFAAETSSRSTKLLHGGIRYLPHFEFGLVREGLLEQKILVKTADFLYQPLEFLIPLYRHRGLADLPSWASIPALLPATLRIGLWLYDTLGWRKGPSSRGVDLPELNEIVTTLRQDDLRGGIIYGDAQTDDARLTMAVLKTAVTRHGAVAINGVRANAVRRTDDGYLVSVTDRRNGNDFEVESRSVVSATWAFAPPPIDGAGQAVPVQLSKGVHLLFDPDDLGIGDVALVLPETDDGRVLFIVPWRGHALFGTTDTPYDGPPGGARPDQQDIDYLMHHLRMYLDVGDVEPKAAFAGVRALAGAADGSTAKASRAHEIVAIAPGYIQVVGGKLTAYRAIAADAADAAARHLGISASSTTDEELLVGAGLAPDALAALTGTIAALGFTPRYAELLLGRYGNESRAIIELLETIPELRGTVGDGHATLAEVVYAARHEAAASIADVALRRTHLAWVSPDHGRADAPRIAATLGGVLGWDDARRSREIADFENELAGEGL